ncbi:MAG: hypothetical protein RML49_06685 [Verrucomicrobiae bacterium]|nr:hypothetical protein [Verrucomicrobiae bacterium]
MKILSLLSVLALIPLASLTAQKKGHTQAERIVREPSVKEIPFQSKTSQTSFYRPPNPVPPPSPLSERMQNFFTKVISGKIEEAYRELLADSTLTQNPTNLKLFIERTSKAFEVYGRARFYEIYDNRKIGERLVVLTYLTAQPVQPLRWRFVFYRPENAWRLIDLRVDDSLDDLIQ